MKIDRAIVVLEDDLNNEITYHTQDKKTSLQLGIEALKEIKHLHESQVLHDSELLPGETK